jgi:hypothetical protein
MCKSKDEAKAKMDRLIESMDRLAAALLSASAQPVTVNVINAPPGTIVKETKDEDGRTVDIVIANTALARLPR